MDNLSFTALAKGGQYADCLILYYNGGAATRSTAQEGLDVLG
jgi:hypothetical protein